MEVMRRRALHLACTTSSVSCNSSASAAFFSSSSSSTTSHEQEEEGRKQQQLLWQPTGNIDPACIAIGQRAELKRTFSQSDLNTFSHLIGDSNPLHQENQEHNAAMNNIGESSSSEGSDVETTGSSLIAVPRVHGILLAAMFSGIFGTLIPGSIYRTQTLKFRAPVWVDEDVLAHIEVINITALHEGCIALCDTYVLRPKTGGVAVEGRAEVYIKGAKKLGEDGAVPLSADSGSDVR
jgi:acyl dehydratase